MRGLRVVYSTLMALVLAGELVARWRHWGELPPSPVRPRGVVFDAGPTAPTLVVLGDSIPAGYGLADATQAWPARLGHLLAQAGTPYRVVDAGIPGETSVQGWARWERDVRPWRPRYVLIAFGLNDGHLAHTPTDDWRWAHVPQGIGRYVRLFHLWRVFRLAPPRGEHRTLAPRLTPAQTAQIMRGLIHRSRWEGAVPIILTPTPITDAFHPEWPDAVRMYQREVYSRTAAAMRRVAYREGVPLVDMAEIMYPPQEQWYQPDGIHLRSEGHARYAEIVYNHLSAMLLGR